MPVNRKVSCVVFLAELVERGDIELFSDLLPG
jgi:hypothetical protein